MCRPCRNDTIKLVTAQGPPPADETGHGAQFHSNGTGTSAQPDAGWIERRHHELPSSHGSGLLDRRGQAPAWRSDITRRSGLWQ